MANLRPAVTEVMVPLASVLRLVRNQRNHLFRHIESELMEMGRAARTEKD